jgi:hypothetical protein
VQNRSSQCNDVHKKSKDTLLNASTTQTIQYADESSRKDIALPPVIVVKRRCAVYPNQSKRRKTHTKSKESRPLEGSSQRAFQPSQRFNLALPLPFGPCLDPAAAGPVPERLELLPNSYCLLLPGRPPLALVLANVSLQPSLQNHFARPVGAFWRCTQARWNHSRGHSSLSHAIMSPHETSLQ